MSYRTQLVKPSFAKKMLMSLIVVGIVCSMSGLAHSMCGEREFLHEGLCCGMCRPGQYVKRHCTPTNYTSCESCEIGTITKEYNNKTKCDNCPTHQYYDINLSYCMGCRSCPKGQYPAELCTKIRNTQCQECPVNHFSNVSNNRDIPCTICTKCRKYKSVCKAEADAVCDEDERTTTRTPMTTGKKTDKTTEKKIMPKVTTVKTRHVKTGATTKYNIFVILAVALPILFVLTCAVVYWFARKKSRCQRGRGFISQRRKYEPLQTGQLLRNQPASFFLKLVELLTPEGRPNWKDLAAELGFSYDEIGNFAVEKKTAAERMLSTWQTKNTSTIDLLHLCCIKIQREDVATYVAEFVAGAVDTVV